MTFYLLLNIAYFHIKIWIEKKTFPNIYIYIYMKFRYVFMKYVYMYLFK